MRLVELFRPRMRAASIFELDLAALWGRGIRGIILDLDNTLLPYGSGEVTETLLTWARGARETGFQLVMATNTRSRRGRAVAEALGIPIARGWVKPARSKLRRAMALMATTPVQTAMIGDQLLTDVLAGNRLGLFTILVTPLSVAEFPTTRALNRVIERLLLRALDARPTDGGVRLRGEHPGGERSERSGAAKLPKTSASSPDRE